MIVLLALAGCPKVPDHLRLDEPDPTAPLAPEVVVTDRVTALQAVLGGDPLARDTRFVEPGRLRAVGADGLAAFVEGVRAIETTGEPIERTLGGLESEAGDTELLALTRGYRLRVAENQLLNTLIEPEAAQQDVIRLVTPLQPGVQDPGLPRTPLAFLGGSAGVRPLAERRVLGSWFAAPEIPLAVPAGLIAAPQYDELRASPVGELLVARAEARDSDADAAFADLRRATLLSLTRAAADRDAEQGAWADLKRATAEELGGPDPIALLLERARAGLTADAGDDRSAGGALLAIAAQRWLDQCRDTPCAGLDRVELMDLAGRWHPEVGVLARSWQAIALDDVIATLQAGRDTALFPETAVDLADALIGTGALAPEVQVLRKTRPDAGVWLSVARSVGEEGVTDWEGAHVALGRHLEIVATNASLAADEASKPLLERIAGRAVP